MLDFGRLNRYNFNCIAMSRLAFLRAGGAHIYIDEDDDTYNEPLLAVLMDWGGLHESRVCESSRNAKAFWQENQYRQACPEGFGRPAGGVCTLVWCDECVGRPNSSL